MNTNHPPRRLGPDAPAPRATTIPRPRAPQVRHPERLLRPVPLSNDEIEHQRQRSIVQQTQIDRLTLAVVVQENEVAALRREVVALRAQIARQARKPVPWHSVALAWLVLRMEALDRWTRKVWQ